MTATLGERPADRSADSAEQTQRANSTQSSCKAFRTLGIANGRCLRSLAGQNFLKHPLDPIDFFADYSDRLLIFHWVGQRSDSFQNALGNREGQWPSAGPE
jgi:hypothetical protein